MVKKPKERLQLKEEILEVGLDRHRKVKKGGASWLLENAPWIMIGLLFLIVIGPFWLMRGSPKAGPVSPLAHLSAGEPTLVWVEGSTSQLRSVKVSVVNSGSVSASDVKVTARIRGKNFFLSGPELIPSGKGEVFSGPTDTLYRSGEAIEIAPTCSNCR